MKVYVLDVTPLESREEEALACLSPQRREKAMRIRRDRERLLSIGAGLLLHMAEIPESLLYGEHGKPFSSDGVFFNLSHSGRFSALALHEHPIGLDIEKIAPVRRAAERALTEKEHCWMLQEDSANRFAFLWTRKEAVLKCTGDGLSRSMRSFSVLEKETELGGVRFSLRSEQYEDYILSAAVQDEDSAFKVQKVDADTLLR